MPTALFFCTCVSRSGPENSDGWKRDGLAQRKLCGARRMIGVSNETNEKDHAAGFKAKLALAMLPGTA